MGKCSSLTKDFSTDLLVVSDFSSYLRLEVISPVVDMVRAKSFLEYCRCTNFPS
jgi:hypothetical protein